MKTDSSPTRFWLIGTIALLSMIGPFSIDTYLPSFPSIEADFSISRAILTQSIAFYLVASATSTLFWGPLSDRIGRRRVILGTLGFYLGASLGCAVADNYSSFMLFRILQGIAASGGMVAGRAMIRDAHDSHGAHRAMAYVMMLFALAPAIAPIVGAWLHNLYGWRSVFYFLALYGGVITVMTVRFLPETLAREHRQSFHPLNVTKLYINILLHSRFQMLVFALGTGFGGLFLYIAAAPTIIFDFLMLDSDGFSLQFVPMTAGIIAGSFISGKLAHRLATHHIISLAFVLLGLASLINIIQSVYLQPTPLTVITPLVLYALGIAMALPAFSLLSIDCFPENRGAAAAVQSFVQVMIAAIIASLVLPLLSASIIALALGQLACLTTAVLLWLLQRYQSVTNEAIG